MKSICNLVFALLFLLSNVIAVFAEEKYAFVTAFENVASIEDDDEKAAAEWFLSTYGTNGDLISTASIKNNQTDLSQYKVIWIHLDKETGNGEIPSEFKDATVLSKITTYYKNGGNLFLSVHATQYLVDLDRINSNRKPNLIVTGLGSSNTDTWGINPNIGLSYDNSSHTIYSKVSFSDDLQDHPIIPLIGSGHKEDHNCMWDLNVFGYSGSNAVSAFESENNAQVLGTWEHVVDYCCAGIVAFFPTQNYAGKCIAVGVGAYEWNQNSGTNSYLRNIKRLTEGVFDYLSQDNSSNEVELSLVAHFPMELDASKTQITEVVSNKSFTVENAKEVRENIPGAEGNALRLDGFSTCATTTFEVDELSGKVISMSLWCALEMYPMMDINGANYDQTVIAGNLKNDRSSGFAFTVNAYGKYGFEVYIDGKKATCYAADALPKYEWNQLTATVNLNDNSLCIYRNNRLVGRSSINGNAITTGTKPFAIGRSFDDIWTDQFRLNTINGLIDDIRIYSGLLEIPSMAYIPENEADLSIPASRFKDEIQRPVFHAMPDANWTNEPHGLIYYNSKYHVFFQKNGAGPYWGRIHWGHIVSDDLITWNEVKPALEPNNSYDIKGSWSGCVFLDDELTNGEPHIFYTAVDLGKASIAKASPVDDNLINWQKAANNPVIPHRPDGLSDDFRDPLVFKAHNEFFMIVGSKKNGKGVATLHKYDKTSKTWSNDGKLFYEASSSNYGDFWEMPVVFPIGDKWVFMATPLGAKDGVEVLYWVGSINQDGTFNPISHTPKEVELSGMSKDGFGMLSPSVMQKDGKTIAIGIVPDRLGGGDNKNLGWAHTFNLPREWSLDSNNNLVQKPYTGLKAMREGAETYSKTNFNLNGSQSLSPVEGKEAELEAVFTVSSDQNQRFGFNVRKNGEKAISISYRPGSNTFTVDARSVDRLSNDSWLFNGLYESNLPKTFSAGETLKMHVFIDHSIMDIFINDTWAFSIRIFPTDQYANGIEIFSEGTTNVQSLGAWKFNRKNTTEIQTVETKEDDIRAFFLNDFLCFENVPENSRIAVYDQTGRLLGEDFCRNNTTNIKLTQKQIYIIKISTSTYSVGKKLIKY